MGEGIGAWASILHVVSTMGVTCNVALAVFELDPLKTYNTTTKLFLFILLERVILALKLLVEAVVPEKSLTLKRIEQVNNECMEEIFEHHHLHVVSMSKTEVENAIAQTQGA